jgi:hypothetical protein
VINNKGTLDMSFKSRQFRKKVEVDDGDEDDQPVLIVQATDKIKKKSSTVKGPSFSFDDEEGDGTEFKEKKSKASKLMKSKLKGPETVEKRVEVVAEVSVAAASVPIPTPIAPESAYSKGSMAALRQQQQFSEVSQEEGAESSVCVDADYISHIKKHGSKGGLEGMELTGDEAANMEEMEEKLENGNGSNLRNRGESERPKVQFKDEVQDMNERRDLAALQASRISTAAEQKRVALDRLGMSGIRSQKEVKDFIPLDNDNTDWEDELIKRGGLKNPKREDFGVKPRGADGVPSRDKGTYRDSEYFKSISSGDGKGAQGSYSQQTNGEYSMKKMKKLDDDSDGVSIEDIQRALMRALETLGGGVEMADRRYI